MASKMMMIKKQRQYIQFGFILYTGNSCLCRKILSIFRLITSLWLYSYRSSSSLLLLICIFHLVSLSHLELNDFAFDFFFHSFIYCSNKFCVSPSQSVSQCVCV